MFVLFYNHVHSSLGLCDYQLIATYFVNVIKAKMNNTVIIWIKFKVHQCNSQTYLSIKASKLMELDRVP